ncbi:sugar phosphate isomerase/epimerase family protein [Cohnella rhizosphaerae]|uniref:Sugar phosphate isomerase/epimerase n=1 Tax=Cohnella rhizosphaerae TaxID=1457232 RepID=A0A9X4QT98_9BACL|nr:TIM barrel protein [Cohnella rhizosphaerae]MDG0810103.1 sugar phosphate isomerase/epimerase [Cohnella rhizosphaerae]
MAELVREVDSPALRALWDPGNEAHAGKEAYPLGYETIKPYAAHVHLKDACAGPDGKARCVPLGSGDVPVIAQLRALAADGYEGLFYDRDALRAGRREPNDGDPHDARRAARARERGVGG